MVKRLSLVSATVVAGLLVFAAPASATHVSCGDTITQSTTLDSDVVCPGDANPGLYIGAGNLTLNLSGHAISIEGPNRAVGILTTPLPGTRFPAVRIRGAGTGRIEGFHQGIHLMASDSSVRGTRITGGNGGMFLDGDRNSALRNVVEMAPGAVLAGIHMLGADVHAAGNTTRGGQTGISTYGNNPRVTLNTVESCEGFSGGWPVGRNGILAREYTTAAVIAVNNVQDCTGGSGVWVHAQQNSPGGASVRRNVVTGNFNGMNVIDPAAVVYANTANANLQTGIYIDLPGTFVAKNTANDNGYYGIRPPPGTIDGGGNTATGNGDTDCINLSCGP